MSHHHSNFHRPDSGIHTVEGNVAGPRAAQLAKKRQQEQEEFLAKKIKVHHNKSNGINKNERMQFAEANEAITASEHTFRIQTVGLVTSDEFVRLTQQQQQAEQQTEGVSEAGEGTGKDNETAATTKQNKRQRKQKRMQQKKVWSTLSFANDEEVTMDEVVKQTSSLKDPTVDTSFLPDKERDRGIQIERRRLQSEWQDTQNRIRKESLEITYSYWDGSGHRRSVIVQKGDTIGTFLELVRKDLSKEFTEMKSIGSDALVYVKEDLMLPSDLTFYDLIVTKARGKSGPLFHFDVHEDIRVGLLDSRVEKDESHPGKVIARQWYDRNKHIFPASRWELYDPTKTYDTYTIHGGQVNNGGKAK